MPRGDLAAWEQRRVADSSPRRFSPRLIHLSLLPRLQNCTNILDYPAPWRCLVPSVAVELPLPIRTRRGKLLGKEGVTTGWIFNTKGKIARERENELKKGDIFFERHVVNLSHLCNQYSARSLDKFDIDYRCFVKI